MNTWPVVPLGDVLVKSEDWITLHPDQTYKEVTVRLWGKGAVLRRDVVGAEIASASRLRVHANEFIISRIDARNGASGLIPDDLEGAIVSNDFPVFAPNPSKLDPRFLGWLSKTKNFVELCKAASEGTTNRVRLKEARFLMTTIPLPLLPEQRRLVERIDALAAKIEEAKRLRAEADGERQALVSSFTNALFESARVRWPIKPLGELAEIRSGVTLGRTIVGPAIRLPYLRVANVQDGHLDLRRMKEVEIKPEEAAKWTLKAGDLLLTEGGDWDKLGRGTVWQDEIPNCIHQNHIFRVRVDPKVVKPGFLATMTSSTYGKSYFQSASKQTTNLASINQRQLKAFPVFVPPIEHQEQLTQQVRDLGERLRSIEQTQEMAGREQAAMLPAILDRAFRGEL